jgi:hypothetical protein
VSNVAVTHHLNNIIKRLRLGIEPGQTRVQAVAAAGAVFLRFQEADDRGEVARTVAGGVAGVLRSDSQLDRKVLDWAGRLGTGQAQAIIAGQLPDKSAQQQDWYNSVQSAQFEE